MDGSITHPDSSALLFELNEQQQEIRDAMQRIMSDFGDDYWLEADRTGNYPHEFRKAIAAGGWLGICMPEDVGGSALGVTEATVMILPLLRDSI